MKAIATAGEVVSGLSKDVVLIVRTMRPLEWIKNLFVFAPIFFSGEAEQMDKLALVGLVFLAFSAMSSAVYIFNDVRDREFDRTHPSKCERPIASGALPVGVAIAGACFLAACAVTLVQFSPPVLAVVLAYAGMNVLYSLKLKHVVILDVFTIAAGFVLRVFAGGLIIQVEPSSWLIMATFLLSLFLGLAKRRHELLLMKQIANSHRPVLEQYTIPLVDILTAVVTPVTLITYILYTLDGTTMARFHSSKLYLTAGFVVFGIFRYLYLIHRKDLGGSPTQLVIKDQPLRTAILAWVVTFAVIVYIG
jgi:4-hydroxybenzoate polyprenyltransferase